MATYPSPVSNSSSGTEDEKINCHDITTVLKWATTDTSEAAIPSQTQCAYDGCSSVGQPLETGSAMEAVAVFDKPCTIETFIHTQCLSAARTERKNTVKSFFDRLLASGASILARPEDAATLPIFAQKPPNLSPEEIRQGLSPLTHQQDISLVQDSDGQFTADQLQSSSSNNGDGQEHEEGPEQRH